MGQGTRKWSLVVDGDLHDRVSSEAVAAREDLSTAIRRLVAKGLGLGASAPNPKPAYDSDGPRGIVAARIPKRLLQRLEEVAEALGMEEAAIVQLCIGSALEGLLERLEGKGTDQGGCDEDREGHGAAEP